MILRTILKWMQQDGAWLVLWLAMAVVQVLFIRGSFGYVRYEGLAESVRNPYWLEQQTIYDGTSSNVGWYATTMMLYRLFGFDLYMARYFRMFLYGVSMLLLWRILYKQVGGVVGILLYGVMGLSPTLLYLNTFQAAYGLDLQYVIIFFYLFLGMRALQQTWRVWISFMVVMFGAMSYPSMLFYLPGITLAWWWKLKGLGATSQDMRRLGTQALLGFMLPLVAAVMYVRDPVRLFYDAQWGGRGIFRGGGNFTLVPIELWDHLVETVKDLFFTGTSFQFELFKVEFSDVYPAVGLAAIFYVGYRAYLLGGVYRKALQVLVLTLLATLLGTLVSSWGMRSATPILVVIYGMMVVAGKYVSEEKTQKTLRGYVVFGVMVLLTHHVWVLPENYAFIQRPSSKSYEHFLGSSMGANPQQAARTLIDIAQVQPLQLNCMYDVGIQAECRYQEAYAVVAGACLWDGLDCEPVFGYDHKTTTYLELSPELWLSFYWEH